MLVTLLHQEIEKKTLLRGLLGTFPTTMGKALTIL
jgi:hypothetical protein